MNVEIECRCCKKTQILKDVPMEGLQRWMNGELIQKALPELNPWQRELLISQTCPECWAEIFKEVEE